MKLIDTINSVSVTRGKGCGEVVQAKGSQMYGDRRLFDGAWWAHNAIHGSRIIEILGLSVRYLAM